MLLLAARTVQVFWTTPDQPGRTTNDFTADYVSARALLDGTNPYAETSTLANRYVADPKLVTAVFGRQARNPHPPPYILLVTPLASFPYVLARNIWLLLCAASVAIAMGTVARCSGARLSTAIAVGAGSFALPPVQAELKIGEGNALLLLAIVVAWLQIRKGRNVWAGVALGVASAFKLYPLFLIIPLLRQRNLKAVGAQLGTTVGLVGAGTLLVGASRTAHLVSEVMPDNTTLWRAAPHNLSLLAMPFRWLTHSIWNNGALDLPGVADLIALVAVVICVIAAFKTPGRLSRDIFWAAVPWMLLMSPILWYEYLILVLPLIYLIVKNHIVVRELPPWFALIGIALVMAWTFDIVPTTNEPVAVLLGVLALPTYGLVILGLSEWQQFCS
jgi:Glycosyltransferase family 87